MITSTAFGTAPGLNVQCGSALAVAHTCGAAFVRVEGFVFAHVADQIGQPAPADSRAAEKPDWMWKADEGLFDRLEGMQRPARFTRPYGGTNG